MDDLQKIYLSVYQELDEAKDDSHLETDMKKRKSNNEKAIEDMKKTKAHKDMVKTAEKHFEEVEHVDEATAMAKRGLNEPAIRQQIAKNTGGGQAADRATALADKKTYGQNGVNPTARQNLARKQRGDFRNTTSSSPGLHGYAHKATTPEDKAKQNARGAQRGVLTPAEKQKLNMEMGYDTFDAILEHLVAEGYADTNASAIAIMANMSEEWREEILDEAVRGSERSIANRITGNDIRSVNRGNKPVYKKPKSNDDVENQVSRSRSTGRTQTSNTHDGGRDSDTIKANKKSIRRLNAAKNIEDKQADGNHENSIDHSNPSKGKSGYMEVPTDYRARRRRASGR